MQENAGIDDELRQEDAATKKISDNTYFKNSSKKMKKKKIYQGRSEKDGEKAKKNCRIKSNPMGYLHNEIETQYNLKNLELG